VVAELMIRVGDQDGVGNSGWQVRIIGSVAKEYWRFW
jgi:hypothetical protein